MVRCPLTLKFGRDVAWLINRELWRQRIVTVNEAYHNSFFSRDLSGVVEHYKTGFEFNFRYRGTYEVVCSLPLMLNDEIDDNYVGELHPHYWEIKELY